MLYPTVCRCIWDLENGKKTTEFDGHCGDVVTISLAPDGNTYLTGSVDKTCKLWDVRETSPRQIFLGHSADVNSVCVSLWTESHFQTLYPGAYFQYHPSGQTFATASEDKSARLFDIRSDQQIASYAPPNANSGFTSCGKH